MPERTDHRGLLLSAAAYIVLTGLLAWDVLGRLTTALIHDEFDPLLIAAILQWNASHLPFTVEWWQFPIFAPAADVLAYSEHLLGVSLVASPLIWVTGNPILAANLTVLLTFPLSALATYVLVRHLTGSSAGAFIAGLVFAFGPYRMSQLAHLQMLSAQWIPIVVLALHRYVETRRATWLVVFGGAWLVQALSNGYALFFVSVFVGLWTMWFVVLRREWRLLGGVVGTLVVVTLPLVPILTAYLRVHAHNGFTRGLPEVVAFSADAGGLLCSPFEVSAWGWLRLACASEGELFPGLVTAALFVAGVLTLPRASESLPRWLTIVRRLVMAFLAVQIASAAAVAVFGPWRLSFGPISARGTSLARPLMLAVGAAFVVAASSGRARAAVQARSVPAFYVLAAFLMWLCALGPSPRAFAETAGIPGPFALLMSLPGFSSLRVPGRFWLMTTLCLAVVAGYAVAALGRRWGTTGRAAAVGLLAVGVLADGWERHMPAGTPPAGPPVPEVLRGGQVLFLPAGDVRDVFPTYYSTVHGFRALNGYSGHEPTHYDAVRFGSKHEVPGVFDFFRARHDLHVVVAAEALRLQRFVEAQQGAERTGASAQAVQYRLPRRDGGPRIAAGAAAPVADAQSSCPPAPVLVDQRLDDIWTCAPQIGSETITLRLYTHVPVGGIRMTLGRPVEFPRALRVETSMDGEVWTVARDGDVLAAFITAALDAPTLPRVVLTFPGRAAAWVRLQQTGNDPTAAWSLREVEVLGPAADD